MNQYLYARVRLLCLCLLVLSFGYAQQSTATDVTADMDAMLTKLVEENLFSGSVLVAHNGTILLSKGYGLADREHNIPNTPQTIFRIASFTKQFTSMGIMILQAQGKLNVADLACTYLPECPEGWDAFTIHQLLIHDPVSPLLEDGNVTYGVLGEIIANASGQSYETFMQTMIFDPLQMTHTNFTPHQETEALGYYSASAVSPAPYDDVTNIQGAAGIYSNVEDVYLWDQALYTEQLITKELLEVVFTPHIPIDTDWADGYGYGWGIGQQNTHKIVGHGGHLNGFDSRIFRYPDDKVTVIVLSNREDVDTKYIATLLSKKVFGEE